MLRLLRSWFKPKYKNIKEFEYSAKGFTQAKRWAKTQPHPFLINLTLWDYVDNAFINSEYKLYEINKSKEENERTVR